MGPHECEAVAGGTVQELHSTRCVEVCGDNVVERLTLDMEEWPGGMAERRPGPSPGYHHRREEGGEVNKTKIEWCDKTINTVVGCSYGCPYCYAKRINARFHYVPDFLEPQFFPERLEQLKSKKPTEAFLTSMSDPADWRQTWAAVLDAIEKNPQHEYLLLSKRPDAYMDLFPIWRHIYGDLKNIWYGVTVFMKGSLPWPGRRE